MFAKYIWNFDDSNGNRIVRIKKIQIYKADIDKISKIK